MERAARKAQEIEGEKIEEKYRNMSESFKRKSLFCSFKNCEG